MAHEHDVLEASAQRISSIKDIRCGISDQRWTGDRRIANLCQGKDDLGKIIGIAAATLKQEGIGPSSVGEASDPFPHTHHPEAAPQMQGETRLIRAEDDRL